MEIIFFNDYPSLEISKDNGLYFVIPEECKGVIWRSKVPYEFLESGKSFEEVVFVHSGTPDKFNVTTTWKDKEGIPYSKEQIVSI